MGNPQVTRSQQIRDHRSRGSLKRLSRRLNRIIYHRSNNSNNNNNSSSLHKERATKDIPRETQITKLLTEGTSLLSARPLLCSISNQRRLDRLWRRA